MKKLLESIKKEQPESITTYLRGTQGFSIKKKTVSHLHTNLKKNLPKYSKSIARVSVSFQKRDEEYFLFFTEPSQTI